PEIMDFYPPVTAMQFDTGTGGIDCSDTMAVTVQGFDASSNPVGTVNAPVPLSGGTVQVTFSAPASRVIITSTHSCGPPGFIFHGVEIFRPTTLASTPQASAASKCAQSAMDAAGKKAKAEASCYAKALQKGVPVDTACIQKAIDNFNKGFTKALAKGDCLTPDTDAASVEAAVDSMLASAIQTVTNGSPGPDICFGN